jgi:hypothetical protein
MAMVPPMLVLQLRAEARAILACHAEYDNIIEQALAPLFDHALASGLVDELGEAAVKAIIEAPFIKTMAVNHGE